MPHTAIETARPALSAQPDFISVAPTRLEAWVALFDLQQLPVLAHSAVALEQWRALEDEVDAHRLADLLGSDPLMTLKLLSHLARLRRGRDGGEVETVTQALVMLGIPPFFRTFGPQDAAEDLLAQQPAALAGFHEVLRRSHRAARFAISFAVHRMDHDADVIHQAALLHDFAEMLLWLRAPTLALAIQRRQRADPGLRSATAQRECLHIELAELQHALMAAWRLPASLVRVADERASGETPQRRTVWLAVRVARHSAAGWHNPALPDDVTEVAQLLQLAPEPALRLLREVDAD